MLVPLGVALSSVAFGTLLALLPAVRERALGPIRTFALLASLGVVTLHLLPEAAEAIGGFAFGVFAGALLLPGALHFFGDRLRLRAARAPESRRAFSLEIAFLGLCLHQLADGVGLGTYGGSNAGVTPHAGVVLAIAGHTVPVVAMIVLELHAAYGLRAALLRAIVLALATSLGILGTELVPQQSMQQASAWIAAFAAGLLVHVVTHGKQPALRGFRRRAPDFLAALLGLGVALGGERAASHAPRELGAALYELALDTLPLLLAGLVGGRVLRVLFDGITARWRPSPRLASFVFYCAAPELGLSTLLVSARFFGWRFAIVRSLGAWSVIGVAQAMGLLAQAARPAPAAARQTEGAPRREPAGESLLLTVDRTLLRTGAFIALGLVAAAFAEVSIPPASLMHSAHSAPNLVVLAIVAGASTLCAPAAVVLGAALVAKGLSPEFVLAGLVIGPALRVVAREARAIRTLLPSVAAVLGAGACVTIAFNRWFAAIELHAHAAQSLHSYGAPTYAAAAVVALLALCGIWRVGASKWLSVLWNRHGGVLELPDDAGERA